MKPKKLSLNQLSIESFITSLEFKKSYTVKGGTSGSCVVATVAFSAGAMGSLAISTGIAAAVHSDNGICNLLSISKGKEEEDDKQEDEFQSGDQNYCQGSIHQLC